VVVVAIASVVTLVRYQRKQRDQQAYALVQQGVKHAALGRRDEAKDAYEQALEVDPNHHLALGNLSIMTADMYMMSTATTPDRSLLEESVAYADRSIALRPDRAGPWNNKAVPLHLLGRLDEAEKACRRAFALEPDFYWGMANLGKVLAMQHKTEEALAAAEKAIKTATLRGDRLNVWATDAWCTLAAIQMWLQQGDPADSLENANRCKRGDPWASVLRARLHLENDVHRDLEKALACAIVADAVFEVPDGRIKRVLALAKLRDGRWSDAARYAADAISYGDLKSPNEFIAAIAEARSGNTDRAREHFGRGKAAWPDNLDDGMPLINAHRDKLWIDTAPELRRLRDEAAGLIGE
jgi:tetratricopeptide (TPR) repeat protein